jgi:hypothetical protein
MSNLLTELAEATNPKRVCSPAMDTIKARIVDMREKNNGGRLDSGQIAELREIVAGDLGMHKSIHDMYSTERIG